MVKSIEELNEKLSKLKTIKEKLEFLKSILKEVKDEKILKTIKEKTLELEKEQNVSKDILTKEEKKPIEKSLEEKVITEEPIKTSKSIYSLPSIQERIQRYGQELENSKYLKQGDIANYVLNKELSKRNLSTFDLLTNPYLRSSFMKDMYNSLGQENLGYLSQFNSRLDILQSEGLINAEDTIKYRAKKFESKSYKLRIKEENGI